MLTFQALTCVEGPRIQSGGPIWNYATGDLTTIVTFHKSSHCLIHSAQHLIHSDHPPLYYIIFLTVTTKGMSRNNIATF